jgi:hypothetical protein
LKGIKVQVSHDEQSIQDAIQSLRILHQTLPDHLCKKYEFLFSYITNSTVREPILEGNFTYYPDSGKIISVCKNHILRLTPVQNEIFYILIKNIYSGNLIKTEEIISFIYKNPKTNHHCTKGRDARKGTLFVHVCHVNALIRHLGLKIYHKAKHGWGIKKGVFDKVSSNERTPKRRKVA